MRFSKINFLRLRNDPRALVRCLRRAAGAWRQAILFISLASPTETQAFLPWASASLARLPADFKERFRPLLAGLDLAAAGISLDSDIARARGARRFLAWSQEQHWLAAS